MTRHINEGFEYRKYKPGKVAFAKSTITDPFMVEMIEYIANGIGSPVQDVTNHIVQRTARPLSMAQYAPKLYSTIAQNAVEQAVFSLFAYPIVPKPTQSPTFSNVTFRKLERSIAADNAEFFPLRGFIDVRRVANIQIVFENIPCDFEQRLPSTGGIATAAATPSGTFIFNVPFMQKLIDYAHLKKLKGPGAKYKSNGGDIPDEYAYLEFLILHEFMHFSHDDFYYQKIIPNANNKIINYVGDFRTNYLLAKSGYACLPMGLYSDDINYDRQSSYVEMYDLVKSEFDKLPKDKQGEAGDDLNGRADDHKPGEEEAQKTDADTGDVKPEDIDKNDKNITKQMEETKDKKPEDRSKTKKQEPSKTDAKGDAGTGGSKPQGIDYNSVMPTFNWASLIKRFISGAKPKMEETYSRPSRRGVGNTFIMTQRGAGAIKPAEKASEFSDSKIGFTFDSSGSMGSVIAKAFSNARKLLSQPMFRNTESVIFKFDSNYQIFKCNFATNRAAKVNSVDDKPSKWPLKTDAIFSEHLGGGTVFSVALASEIIGACAQKRNIIFFLDSDILSANNLTTFLTVLKAYPRQIFIIFDTRDTYISFRQQTGLSTPNITYFT